MTKQVLHRIAFVLAAALTLAANPARAGWRDQITAYDAQRLADISDSRIRAAAEAEHGNGTGDFNAIKQTFEPEARSVPERALYGNWRCRQMKLGGMTDYAVFNWFPCRITRA